MTERGTRGPELPRPNSGYWEERPTFLLSLFSRHPWIYWKDPNPIDVRERRERWVRGEKGKWRKMWFIRCTPLRRVSWMNIRLALLRDRERVDEGKDAPKCVGAALSLRIASVGNAGCPKCVGASLGLFWNRGRRARGPSFAIARRGVGGWACS